MKDGLVFLFLRFINSALENEGSKKVSNLIIYKLLQIYFTNPMYPVDGTTHVYWRSEA
jgi:hypothetical protein